MMLLYSTVPLPFPDPIDWQVSKSLTIDEVISQAFVFILAGSSSSLFPGFQNVSGYGQRKTSSSVFLIFKIGPIGAYLRRTYCQIIIVRFLASP